MKSFILKLSLFTLPFLSAYALNTIFFQNEDDLDRVGYIYSNPLSKPLVSDQVVMDRQYTCVSEIHTTSKDTFDVLTIGDSFSCQGRLGYQNYLSHRGIDVLHLDILLTGHNPLQRVIELMNGGFFDTVQVKYVVLQSVERYLIKRSHHLDFSKSIQIESLMTQVRDSEVTGASKAEAEMRWLKERLPFFSDVTLKIPLSNIQYLYTDKPTFSQTYKILSNNDQLFSGQPEDLLFYFEDISELKCKNDSTQVALLNSILNEISFELSKRGIQLISLISPDKYDLYYPYILDKSSYDVPLFATCFAGLDKTYNNVPSFEVLSNEIKKSKDVYYYADTHWSPIAADLIANEIYEIIGR